ncbi:MAG: hypothetical protein HKP25_01870 [Marinicaulis sp.]|nr:hypothetical protein [Marinicaulis sp.]
MVLNHQRVWFAAAFLWGLAEATFFFIVPDVLLTASVILFGLAFALRLAGAAVIGAILGGAIMWRWGAAEPEAAREFLLSIPLVGDDLLSRASDEMKSLWPVNLTLGAVTGAPYKIYAVEVGAGGVNFWPFMIVSFFARLARFALLIGLFTGGYLTLRRFGRARWDWRFHGGVWLAVYAAYTAVRLNA